jgi:hypothetical protein
VTNGEIPLQQSEKEKNGDSVLDGGVMEVMRKGMVPAEMANGRIVSLCTPDPAASVRRARPHPPSPTLHGRFTLARSTPKRKGPISDMRALTLYNTSLTPASPWYDAQNHYPKQSQTRVPRRPPAV